MSNCEAVELPVVEAEPHQFREVLRCLIHTIVFNRSLGYVRPRDVDSELFDITYVQCASAALETTVEARISDFCAAMERRLTPSASLCVGFFQTRKKAHWFGSKDEKLYWEQWHITLKVLDPASLASPARGSDSTSAAAHARTEAGLQLAVQEIVRFVNEKRDHIPPVTSTSTVTFPFDITITGSKSGLEAKLHEVKKMVLQTAPPPML